MSTLSGLWSGVSDESGTSSIDGTTISAGFAFKETYACDGIRFRFRTLGAANFTVIVRETATGFTTGTEVDRRTYDWSSAYNGMIAMTWSNGFTLPANTRHTVEIKWNSGSGLRLYRSLSEKSSKYEAYLTDVSRSWDYSFATREYQPEGFTWDGAVAYEGHTADEVGSSKYGVGFIRDYAVDAVSISVATYNQTTSDVGYAIYKMPSGGNPANGILVASTTLYDVADNSWPVWELPEALEPNVRYYLEVTNKSPSTAGSLALWSTHGYIQPGEVQHYRNSTEFVGSYYLQTRIKVVDLPSKRWDGTQWVPATIKRYDGSGWVEAANVVVTH